MTNNLFKNFESKCGQLINIDEMVSSFDLPRYDHDTLILNGLKVATINRNDYSVKFVDENTRAFFNQEAISSGLVDHIKENLKINEVPENIAVLVAINRNTDEANNFYNEDIKKSKLSSLIDNIFKTEEEKHYEKLVSHRSKLKDEVTKKSPKIKL